VGYRIGDDTMTRPRRGYTDGPFGQIHYQDTGGDGEPLILCHQAPITSRQYDRVYPLLAAAGIRAIGVDTPGFGLSDEPDHIPSVEEYATAIPPVLDHLGITQTNILGHHTGALIATEVSLQFPERVKNLIINGPSPFTPEEIIEWNGFVDKFEKGFVHKEDGTHLSELYARRWQWAEPGTDPSLVTRYVVEQLQGYGPFWYGHNAAFAYDHNVTLGKIKHRTMIMINTGDIIYDHAKKAHSMRPDFEFCELQGGGIDITDQMPEEWVAAVTGFILPKA
jgi:pimeloyl-ACP methyl ester carboxylesterase|tara:strand:- start:316 stop:1152 length:837 start_codon:yes stop_codon:yes gene_type:complete